MREVAIVGVGLHKFGRFPEKNIEELGRVAILNALDDAGASPGVIQAAFTGHVLQGTGAGLRVVNEVIQTGLLIDVTEKACASSSTALRHACWAIQLGLFDVALVVGFEKMQRGLLGAVTDPSAVTYDQLAGIRIMPGVYALQAMKYMHQYGARPEHFAHVSVKSHRNATMNPYAQYQKALTLEEVLNSRMIADPITLYQCSPTTDGASAAVVCAREKAHHFRGKPIIIAGYASGTPPYTPAGGGDLAEGMVESIARQAFKMAGLGPEDIDVTQVHDAFTPGEVFSIEALDYCPRGEGACFIWEGKADINGEKPVNTDGGLVSRGHPIGATGLAQIAEIVWQLRGEAGPRQVPRDPRAGLCHNVGLGGCNITILKK